LSKEIAMKRTFLTLLVVTLLGAVMQAFAQSWPNKPVKLIVSQAAGGAPDIVARLVGDRLSRMWGQQVLVDNRPGAGNVIGAQLAARSAPDGYTLFFATAAALVTNPYTFKTLPYDPARDFVPVGMVGKAPFFVLVHPSVQAKTLSELFALEKSQPGKLTYATDGPRNFSGMVAAWLNKLGGTNILQVPYATMPQGIQDTVAGRTQVVILAIPVAAPQLKQGALRALAFTSATRAPGYENVPPVAETFSGFDFVGWFAFVTPTGTPQDVVRRINRDLDTVLKDPEIVQRLRGMGIFTDGADTPEGTAAFVRAELATWGKVVKEIGLQPE
jgi:tripartite-type tricarboxylate transporter receptor subunit TctC